MMTIVDISQVGQFDGGFSGSQFFMYTYTVFQWLVSLDKCHKAKVKYNAVLLQLWCYFNSFDYLLVFAFYSPK